ncbi:nickel/cobalt transporter [Methylocella silvestris]|uniref:Nickel/cobalt efflux system n=1 Tax=Methylocella silvestris TaxID=199596 RepID=A0A2J7TC08_METSI|nr:nickel/cobalt transporter [Methylocella silvestris]PNG24296.1 high frequency lysogenization protein HflD [Methylocella silvestris]
MKKSSKLLTCLLFLAMAGPSFAQGVHHPFAVGVNEGAASATGFSGWILAQESWFYRLLSGAVRAIKSGGSNGFMLAALSFGYGVFHAAGPGHGKAVIAAYMVADERQFYRGLVISLAAALLQGVVAVALVAIAFLAVGTTAKHMTAAANWIEIASFAGVTLLGAVLTLAKGRALYAAWRQAPAREALAAFGPLQPAGFSSGQFVAAEGPHIHTADCGHVHGLNPDELGEGFSWKKALLTVAAAGSRPCSGAILVLVFASAQGVFAAGVGAVLAMSLGVAITTGALAASAVFAKKTVGRLLGAQSWRGMFAGRLFEAAAALAVLAFGLLMLTASLAGGSLGG